MSKPAFPLLTFGVVVYLHQFLAEDTMLFNTPLFRRRYLGRALNISGMEACSHSQQKKSTELSLAPSDGFFLCWTVSLQSTRTELLHLSCEMEPLPGVSGC